MFNPWFTLWDGGVVDPLVTVCETGVYTVSGQDATFSRTGNLSDPLETGVYTIAGQAVTFRGGYVPPTNQGGGQVPFTFTIQVGTRKYTFADVDSLVAFLQEQEEKAKQRAKIQAKRDAKRVLKIGPAKSKPKPPDFVVSSPESEIAKYLAEVRKKSEQQYWDELQAILGMEAEEVEDIMFLAKLNLDDE